MKQKKFYTLWDVEDSPNIYFFAVQFNKNPDDESSILKFIETNRLCISEKLGTLFAKHIDNSFSVETWHRKFRLVPKFIKAKNREKYIIVKDYLSKKTKFVSFIRHFKLSANDFSPFINAFIDYPMKCRYQDIFCFSKNNNVTIIISHHADIWFVSNQKEYLYSLYCVFQNEFDYVIPGDNFKKYIQDN